MGRKGLHTHLQERVRGVLHQERVSSTLLPGLDLSHQRLQSREGAQMHWDAAASSDKFHQCVQHWHSASNLINQGKLERLRQKGASMPSGKSPAETQRTPPAERVRVRQTAGVGGVHSFTRQTAEGHWVLGPEETTVTTTHTVL